MNAIKREPQQVTQTLRPTLTGNKDYRHLLKGITKRTLKQNWSLLIFSRIQPLVPGFLFERILIKQFPKPVKKTAIGLHELISSLEKWPVDDKMYCLELIRLTGEIIRQTDIYRLRLDLLMIAAGRDQAPEELQKLLETITQNLLLLWNIFEEPLKSKQF